MSALIFVFIIWFVSPIVALSFGIIDAVKSGLSQNVIIIPIQENTDNTQINSASINCGDIALRQIIFTIHSEHAFLPTCKDVLYYKWHGRREQSRWKPAQVAPPCNINPNPENRSICVAYISDNQCCFRRVARKERERFNAADDQFWSMRGDKFLSPEVNGLFQLAHLSGSGAPKSEGKRRDSDSAERDDKIMVALNRIYDRPQDDPNYNEEVIAGILFVSGLISLLICVIGMGRYIRQFNPQKSRDNGGTGGEYN